MKNSLTLQEPSPDILEHLKTDLRFLDFEVQSGAQPWEIEGMAYSATRSASLLFFGWLISQGIEEGSEVLADLAKNFLEDLYLCVDEQKPRRGLTLSTVTKPRIEEFLHYVEFAVSDKLWNEKINPFDGLLLFYQFLEALGCEVNLPRRTRAIEQLRRSMKKRPCSMPQAGSELTQ